MAATDELDRTFHALSDATRRAMVHRLGHGPASVTELASPLQMTLAAVMQHLRVLEDGGLIVTRKVGRVRTCTLNTDGMKSAEGWLSRNRTAWEQRLDRLGALLDEEPRSEEHERRNRKLDDRT